MKIPVFLVDPRADRDFTNGKAWELLLLIRDTGGQVVPDAEAPIDLLIRKHRKSDD